MLLFWAVFPRFKEPDLKRLLRLRYGTMVVVATIVPPSLVALFTICVNAVDCSSMLLGRDGLDRLGLGVGRYGNEAPALAAAEAAAAAA